MYSIKRCCILSLLAVVSFSIMLSSCDTNRTPSVGETLSQNSDQMSAISGEGNRNYGIETYKGMVELDTLLTWNWEDYQNAGITSQQVDELITQLKQDNQPHDEIQKLIGIAAELKDGKSIEGPTDNYSDLYELEFPNGSSIDLEGLLKYSVEECRQSGITAEMLKAFVEELENKNAPQESVEAIRKLAEQLN